VEELIEQAATELAKPAGDAKRFASLASILKHHPEFVRRCHKTWKKWHGQAVRQLLFHEGFLLREKTHPIGHGTREFGEYNRAVWRRVNDAVIWSLFGGQRHRVKRLCLYRKRGNLSESNPEHAMAMLAEINARPMSIAIWNDATSCVDIGDLTVISDGRRPVPRFIELKAGTVNAAISELLRAEGERRDVAVEAFKAKYGKKAVHQLNRVLRQKQISDQALELLIKEKGVDPVTGYQISVTETTVAPQTYDETLATILNTALTTAGEVIECVDGCLWIYANGERRWNWRKSTLRFLACLDERVPGFSDLRQANRPHWDRDKVRRLSTGVYHPLARPLYLRTLPPAQIASLTLGVLRENVMLYLDWTCFGQLIQKAGGELKWGSPRDVGRARAMHPGLRPPIIGGRLPQIHVGEAIEHVTDPNLIEMFFDGVTPWSMAQIIVGFATNH
jgi:hypothetical protein